MAGFFGLFNYSKPGPGVEKGGPRKKSFVVFFEIFFRKFWKLIIANLLHVVVSLPVLTMGLSNAGLTFITRNFAREKHAFIKEDFFDTIKKNLKQALPMGIINLLITAILAFDIFVLFFQGGEALIPNATMRTVAIGVLLLIVIIFSFMKYYMYMLMVTFKFTLKQIYKNSLIFAFVGLPRNFLIFIVMGLIYGIAFLLVYFLSYIGIIIVIFMGLLMVPAFRSLLIQFVTFPIIKRLIIDPYYDNNPNEDRSRLTELNIYDDEMKEEMEEEKVFEDNVFKPSGGDDEDKPVIPRQYSREEIARLHQKQYDDDDDDTI